MTIQLISRYSDCKQIREDDVYDIKIISSAKVRSYAILQKKMKIAIEKYPFIFNEKIGPYFFRAYFKTV